jgi:hypothetical protein
MHSLTTAVVRNYLTTFFGVLGGLPLIVAQSGVILNAKWNHYLMMVGGIGLVGLGVVAKAFNVSSTPAQKERQ